jgi:cytosolic nonspecific dipeptidase
MDRIPSVSAQLNVHYQDVIRMMEWTRDTLIEPLKPTLVVMHPNPASTSERPLPPILTASFMVNPEFHTVCVYGHLDVQPAERSDGWATDPFVVTEIDGKLFGRGTSDDKGPALSWLWAIEAFQKLGIPLPVNVKIVFEGMEEYGSEGIFDFIAAESSAASNSTLFFDDVDYFCISDNVWLGKRKPCLTYGLRGIAYFALSVKCCEQDLHSGVFGGTVHEAMTDLVHILSTLVESRTGQVLVPGIMDDVRPLSDEEYELYNDIDFNIDDYRQETRVNTVSNKLLYNDSKHDLLMHRWRYPTLSIHGIEGAFSGAGAKTVIPAKAIGKFSLRLVPDQSPAKIESLVRKHVEECFSQV